MLSTLILEDGNAIAYHKFMPNQVTTPGIIFLGGFMSDMEGSKAMFLEAHCQQHNIPFIRFDYYGHGQSSGTFEDGTIGRWKEDAIVVLDHLAEGPQILVGSSMGGWIMLLAALARPERIAGIVGIASAPDFTETLIWDALKDEEKEILRTKGVYNLPSEYCNDPSGDPEPYPITMQLIEEARQHMLLQDTIPLTCPARLLHGMQDQDVPYDISLQLCQQLTSNDVTISLIKNGEHRMSSDANLSLLQQEITSLLAILT